MHTKHLVLEPGDTQGLRGPGSVLDLGSACPQFLQKRPGASSSPAALTTRRPHRSGPPGPSVQQSPRGAPACSPRLGPWSAPDTGPGAPSSPPPAYRPHTHTRCYSVALPPHRHPSRVLQEPLLSRWVTWATSAPQGRGGRVGIPPWPPCQQIAPRALHSPAMSCLGAFFFLPSQARW